MNQPDQLVSTNIFEQIDAICREFRRECKEGKQPHLELYLENVGQDARSMLFRNLLTADIDYRRRTGENPTSSDYIKRFPEYARLIRQAFYESTMMSMDASVSTPRFSMRDQFAGETMAMPLLAANRLGDYELIEEIGRGGFGIVYKARHIQRKNFVALKTLPIGQEHRGLDDAERLHKFRREFRSLVDINHPNLIGMQTLEFDCSQWFFTMDLIEGDDFLGYVRPDDQLNEPKLREVLPQLANGIMALHGQRIIHRDLKPSNVMIDDAGKVTILDFGLVVELEQRTDQTMSMQSSRFAGTPLYAAPEQIMGKSSSASDWYSLGVMLHEALSGRRPFSGSALEVFEAKRHREAPLLVGHPGIPQDLADLAFGFMQKDPAKRPDALQIAKALSLTMEPKTLDLIDEELDEPIAGSGQVLIGRSGQLAELRNWRDQLLKQRKPIATFIVGRSGEGKSSLAEEFLGPLRLDTDVLVLSGRCYDRESVPFKAIDSIIDSMVSYLRGLTNDDVTRLLPQDIRMLAHLFPVLGRVEAVAELTKNPVGQLDSKQIRNRAFAAFRELLYRVSLETPIVMFIDDLQWGDADSAEALCEFLLAEQPPCLLFLGSYRSDEADESPFLVQWNNVMSRSNSGLKTSEVNVGPLSRGQCVELVVARIGIDNDTIRRKADELHQSTGGNPYFLDQLIECFDAETGSFSAMPLAEVIESKLQRLPADAGKLLDTISVSGQAISVQEIAAATGDADPSISTITHMRTERLVRLVGPDELQMVDTYHDKVRETVVDKLSADARIDLHRRIGEAIERRNNVDSTTLLGAIDRDEIIEKTPDRIFDLAYHFERAGVDDKSLVYSTLAAEHARQQFALDVAIENYQIAERVSAAYSDNIRYRIHAGLGQTHELLGNYAQSEKSYGEAIPLAANQQQAISAQAHLAQITYRTKSVKQGVAAYIDLLAAMGVKVPRSRQALWWENLCMLLSRRREKDWTKNPESTGDVNWRDDLIIQLLHLIVYPFYFSESAKAKWASLAQQKFCRRNIESANRSFALMDLGGLVFMSQFGWRSRSLKCCQQALEIADSLDDLNLQANAYFLSGYMGVPESLEDSLKHLSRGLDLYQRINDVFRISYSRYVRAGVHARMGNIMESVKDAQSAFEAAIAFGQDFVARLSLGPWARATDGNFPFLELKSCTGDVEGNLPATAQMLIAESTWHRFHQRPDESVRSASEAVNLGTQNNTLEFRMVYPVLARAYRYKVESDSESNAAEHKRTIKNWYQAAKNAFKINKRFEIDLPFTLREYSLALAHQGSMKKALRMAQQGCQLAKHQSAKFEYAQSLLVCGQVGEQLKLTEATQQIKEAESQLAKFEKKLREATIESFGTA